MEKYILWQVGQIIVGSVLVFPNASRSPLLRGPVDEYERLKFAHLEHVDFQREYI